MTLFRRLLALPLALALAFAGACAVSLTGYDVIGQVSAGETAVQNISEMIEDLVPSFVLLIFVMTFMLMLLTMVERVGKR